MTTEGEFREVVPPGSMKWALERLIASPAYLRAWSKLVHGRPVTPEETQALRAASPDDSWVRVPLQLDPTLTLTEKESGGA